MMDKLKAMTASFSFLFDEAGAFTHAHLCLMALAPAFLSIPEGTGRNLIQYDRRCSAERAFDQYVDA
jgi:hypothetical protein